MGENCFFNYIPESGKIYLHLAIIEILIYLFFNHSLNIISKDMYRYNILEEACANATLETADLVFIQDLANFRMLLDNFLDPSVP